ncbi:XkdQ/YqbQ family protein [Brevibacillus daliensis]|uniref:XkdQ/YqbQ family protein n=1 Tax=Brevibacillus daliensis TaxID=2892995 RepID=UPI001E39F0E4|nr:hypothetical protein [Brevibacillus daliensis]
MTAWEVWYDDAPIHVQSANWSGDITGPARKLDVSLVNTTDGRRKAFPIELGKELRLYSDGKELFRGLSFTHQIDDRGNMSVTAYDDNIYLTKNQDTQIFRNMTASAIVKKLCGEFGVPVGQIDDTGYVIPKLVLRDKTLWDMMITALTVTQKQTGRRYFICSKEGKLHLLARKEQPVRWVLENGVNLLSASYSQSIEDMRTQVKVIGGDEKKKQYVAVVKNEELIKRFGIMQHLENADNDATKSQVEQLAKQLLKDLGTINDDASIEALGISEVYAGTGVYVQESMTEIIGGYYVSVDSHTFEGAKHTMSLTLSATDDLPTIEYEPPPEPKEKKKKGRKGRESVVDKIFKDVKPRGT